MEDFPTKNRVTPVLEVCRIEVEHAGGVKVFDPNAQIIFLHTDADQVRTWQPIPGRCSDISGKPAILYRSSDLELVLTVPEWVAMVGNELEPHQFFALRERFGDFFEIHDDFYDPDTGEASQPREMLHRVMGFPRGGYDI